GDSGLGTGIGAGVVVGVPTGGVAPAGTAAPTSARTVVAATTPASVPAVRVERFMGDSSGSRVCGHHPGVRTPPGSRFGLPGPARRRQWTRSRDRRDDGGRARRFV